MMQVGSFRLWTGHGMNASSPRNRRDEIADVVTAFSGSFLFVGLHVVWFIGWIVANLIPPLTFDPFPFGLLTLIVSLEAIFLSTFVLISQNRTTKRDEARAREDYLTNARSEAWSELVGERLGVQQSEVDRRANRIIGRDERKLQRDN